MQHLSANWEEQGGSFKYKLVCCSNVSSSFIFALLITLLLTLLFCFVMVLHHRVGVESMGGLSITM